MFKLLSLITLMSSAAFAGDVYLPPSNFVLKSMVAVNFTKRFARLPVHKGSFNGKTYWYVLTDVSDEFLANKLGLNFAPKLANAGNNCPSCVQVVEITNDISQTSLIEFKGVPDFSPKRTLIPGPN